MSCLRDVISGPLGQPQALPSLRPCVVGLGHWRKPSVWVRHRWLLTHGFSFSVTVHRPLKVSPPTDCTGLTPWPLETRRKGLCYEVTWEQQWLLEEGQPVPKNSTGGKRVWISVVPHTAWLLQHFQYVSQYCSEFSIKSRVGCWETSLLELLSLSHRWLFSPCLPTPLVSQHAYASIFPIRK